MAFQIDNYKVEKVFFLTNNLIKLLLYFNIKIFKIIGGSIAGHFYIIIHREFRGLATFLEYNPMAFYLD